MTNDSKKRPSKSEGLRSKIRGFLDECGPMTATECLQRMQKRKLLDVVDVEDLIAKQFKRTFNDAYREHDPDGLPFGGPMPSASDPNAQESVVGLRQQWLFADYVANFKERTKQAADLVKTADLIADECEKRYGRRPAA